MTSIGEDNGSAGALQIRDNFYDQDDCVPTDKGSIKDDCVIANQSNDQDDRFTLLS